MKNLAIILGKLFYSAINLLYFLCEVIESNKMVKLDIENIPNVKKHYIKQTFETYESNLFCYRQINCILLSADYSHYLCQISK